MVALRPRLPALQQRAGLAEQQREQVTEYGTAVLGRAYEVVGAFEYASVGADDTTRSRITRLIDPRPFSDAERPGTAADFNVQRVTERAGLPGTGTSVLQVLRDRDELTDEETAQLDASDVTDLHERFIAPTTDRWPDDRHRG